MPKRILSSIPSPAWAVFLAISLKFILDRTEVSVIDALGLPPWPTFIFLLFIIVALVFLARRDAKNKAEKANQKSID
jgi:hypothetical protein